MVYIYPLLQRTLELAYQAGMAVKVVVVLSSFLATGITW